MKAFADAQPCGSPKWCRQSRASCFEEVSEGCHQSQSNGGCNAQGLQGMIPAHSIAGSGVGPVGQCMAAQQYETWAAGSRTHLFLSFLNRMNSA